MERLTKKCTDTDGKYLPYTIDNYCGVYPDSTLGKLVERLAYYEDLEEQDRLIELPCKVGTKVWYIFGREIYECEVVEIDILSKFLTIAVRNADFSIKENRPATIFHTLTEVMFKSHCFFTKEEAEERLKELHNN